MPELIRVLIFKAQILRACCYSLDYDSGSSVLKRCLSAFSILSSIFCDAGSVDEPPGGPKPKLVFNVSQNLPIIPSFFCKCLHQNSNFALPIQQERWLRPLPKVSLRVRAKITSHFSILASAHLCPMPHSQNPRNSSLFLWFYSLGSAKPEPNLSANSAKLFLREP